MLTVPSIMFLPFACLLLILGMSCYLRAVTVFDIISNTRNDLCITKTCLYNFDPIKPHFYMVKLGFTGVYIIFLISA